MLLLEDFSSNSWTLSKQMNHFNILHIYMTLLRNFNTKLTFAMLYSMQIVHLCSLQEYIGIGHRNMLSKGFVLWDILATENNQTPKVQNSYMIWINFNFGMFPFEAMTYLKQDYNTLYDFNFCLRLMNICDLKLNNHPLLFWVCFH